MCGWIASALTRDAHLVKLLPQIITGIGDKQAQELEDCKMQMQHIQDKYSKDLEGNKQVCVMLGLTAEVPDFPTS
jgi:maltodextrin utilization protein YvdJ